MVQNRFFLNLPVKEVKSNKFSSQNIVMSSQNNVENYMNKWNYVKEADDSLQLFWVDIFIVRWFDFAPSNLTSDGRGLTIKTHHLFLDNVYKKIWDLVYIHIRSEMNSKIIWRINHTSGKHISTFVDDSFVSLGFKSIISMSHMGYKICKIKFVKRYYKRC